MNHDSGSNPGTPPVSSGKPADAEFVLPIEGFKGTPEERFFQAWCITDDAAGRND